MLCLHQTTRIGKGEPAGVGGKTDLQYARELAERGYVTLAPDYPTASESGLVGMDHSSWYGVWGPKKLPADLVSQYNKTINDAVQELKNEGQLAKFGIEPVSETPSQFEGFAKKYTIRNAELLKASNFEQI
jgi:tripartite-type tricarboxylate transporter receptor subunit TctC